MSTHTKFNVKIYVLTAAEGGRTEQFFSGYRSKFVFGSASVTGGITLPEDHNIAQPGDNVHVTVEIVEPVAMEPGLNFEVQEPGKREFRDNQWVQVSDDKTVIRGEVTEVLK